MQFPGLYASDRYPPHIVHLPGGGGSFYPGSMRTFGLRRPRDQYYHPASTAAYDMFYPTNLLHLSDDTGSFYPNSVRKSVPRRPVARPSLRPVSVETGIPFMFGTRLVTPQKQGQALAAATEPHQHSYLDEALNVAKSFLGSLVGSGETEKPVPREGGSERIEDKGDGEKSDTASTASESESGEVVSKRPQWTRSLSVPGFAPEDIDVKVRDDKVHIHAKHNESNKNCPYVVRWEMEHTVELPKNVDQENLECSLKPDGYLQLRAPLSNTLRLERKEPMKSLESKKPEKAELKAIEGRALEAVEDKSEKQEALENHAKQIEHVTFLTEKLLSDVLSSKADEVSQVEIPVQRLVQTLLAEAAHVPEVLSETLSELTGQLKGEEGKSAADSSEKQTSLPKSAGETQKKSPLTPAETQKKQAEKEKPAPAQKPAGEVQKKPDTENLQTPTATPGSDAISKQELYCKTVPLAGFSPGNINVNLQGRNVTVTATRQAWFEDAAYTECIERRVELPSHVDPYSVRCMYEDSGNLVITARLKGHQQQVPVEVASKAE